MCIYIYTHISNYFVASFLSPDGVLAIARIPPGKMSFGPSDPPGGTAKSRLVGGHITPIYGSCNAGPPR